MLSVYTRHYPPCAQSDPYYRRCHCPKWIMGTVETTGAFVRVSARTRAWERAEKKARLMDVNASDPSGGPADRGGRARRIHRTEAGTAALA